MNEIYRFKFEDVQRSLADIPGLSDSKISISPAIELEDIAEAIRAQFPGIRLFKRSLRLMAELWGVQWLEHVKADPYALCETIDGIGFITADEIAFNLGYQGANPARIKAAIIHALKETCFSEGHVYVPVNMLKMKADKWLKIQDFTLIESIIRTIDGITIDEDDNVYLNQYLSEEVGIAQRLSEIKALPLESFVAPDISGVDMASLAKDQREAIAIICNSPVSVLTGAAGTGKTYVIKQILNAFAHAQVALCAPTGKAAKRMNEQTGKRATTIHVMLNAEMTPSGFRFAFNEFNRLPHQVIIIDESSMIEQGLFNSILKALKPSTRLILVGDYHQLPPVGAGNVLKDIMESEAFPVAELTEIKRQAKDSAIIINSHKVNAGEAIDKKGVDYTFIERDTESDIAAEIIKQIDALKNNFDSRLDIQVLSPLREKSSLSCKELNIVLQEHLNKNRPISKYSPFCLGDKVIQTKNDYQNGIINGDIGFIQKTKGYKDIIVKFLYPDRFVTLPMSGNNLMLAYAITVHKFQGSEAPICIIPIHPCFGNLITQRNWLYTAMTRAKNKLILIGQYNEAIRMIHRNNQAQRYTTLQERLRGEI